MKHFLVVFDRRRGQILRKQEYARSGEALRARFRAEDENPDRQNVEIVVLSAESEDDLHLTHSRYFRSVGGIAAEGLDRLANLAGR